MKAILAAFAALTFTAAASADPDYEMCMIGCIQGCSDLVPPESTLWYQCIENICIPHCSGEWPLTDAGKNFTPIDWTELLDEHEVEQIEPA